MKKINLYKPFLILITLILLCIKCNTKDNIIEEPIPKSSLNYNDLKNGAAKNIGLRIATDSVIVYNFNKKSSELSSIIKKHPKAILIRLWNNNCSTCIEMLFYKLKLNEDKKIPLVIFYSGSKCEEIENMAAVQSLKVLIFSTKEENLFKIPAENRKLPYIINVDANLLVTNCSFVELNYPKLIQEFINQTNE